MSIAVACASSRMTAVFRVEAHTVLQRLLDTETSSAHWGAWEQAPFDREAVAVAALSGYDEHIELFVLDTSGHVWNRWWWREQGWVPETGFNPLGKPFSDRDAIDLSAASAGAGHFVLLVEAADGACAMLPHITRGSDAPGSMGNPGSSWVRQDANNDTNIDAPLVDGWWPPFASASRAAYPRG